MSSRVRAAAIIVESKEGERTFRDCRLSLRSVTELRHEAREREEKVLAVLPLARIGDEKQAKALEALMMVLNRNGAPSLFEMIELLILQAYEEGLHQDPRHLHPVLHH